METKTKISNGKIRCMESWAENLMLNGVYEVGRSLRDRPGSFVSLFNDMFTM